jgi:predicted type IV restriction endonuclease
MNRKSLKEKVTGIVETAIQYQNKKDRSDETNTVVKFVVSLFNLLEWDTVDNMEFEYRKKGPKAADIALKIDNKVEILVEVKPIYRDLNDEVAKQAAYYLKEKGVRWGVITNGLEIRCYDMKFMPLKSHRGREIFRLTLDSVGKIDKKKTEQLFDVLLILSKHNVEIGFLDHVGNNFLESYREIYCAFKKIGLSISFDDLRILSVYNIVKNHKKFPFKRKIFHASKKVIKERSRRHFKIPMSDRPGNYDEDELKENFKKYFSSKRRVHLLIRDILLPLCLKHEKVTRELIIEELGSKDPEIKRPGTVLSTISREIGYDKRDYLRQIIKFDRVEGAEHIKDNFRIEPRYRNLVKSILGI